MLIIKTKLQVKSDSSNLTNLCGTHFKNIQCTIIKKSTVSIVYVEDKKVLGPSQFKQSNFLVDASM